MKIIKIIALIALVLWMAAASWVMYRLAGVTASNSANIMIIVKYLNGAQNPTPQAPATTATTTPQR
jgi:hypothetical protein